MNVFEYMDVRLFLGDYFREAKKLNPSFSYGKWTEELGLNNKTLLRLILQGKRNISDKTAGQFKRFLKLDSRAAEYFDSLVEYSQARTVAQKQAMGSRLIQLHRKNFIQPEIGADSTLLEDAYGPLILTLVSSSLVALNQDDIEIRFCLEKGRASLILDKLVKNGLLHEQKGYYTAVHSTFKIADHFGHAGLHSYYRHWFKESIAAIALPFDVRRFRSLQLVLSKSEFDDLNQNFQEFILANLSRYEKNTLEDRRVYLLNSALFPVSQES